MQKPNLDNKEILNPREAIEYFALSARKFYALIGSGEFDFMAFYKTRKLILKSEFERYLHKHPELKRRDNCGRSETR